MPVLSNPKHEAFAQSLAKGETADDAYVQAGYQPNRGNAARLKANESVRARLAELQGKAAAKTEITATTLIEELEAARLLALEARQASAAVSATMGKAKLTGHIVDRREHSGPNGGPIPVLDLSKLSDAQLDTLAEIFGPMAASEEDNPADAEGTT
jgi:hypothetical protein